MMRFFINLALTMAVALATPIKSGRIIGDSVTTIDNYPEMVALLRGSCSYFVQECGGVILNYRSILTAAHCAVLSGPSGYRVRVGSTYNHWGGRVFNIFSIINHPNFNRRTMDSDIGVLHVVGTLSDVAIARPARIAGNYYFFGDNEEVWATGWGMTVPGNVNSGSVALRHVQIWTVNQDVCRKRYANRIVNGVFRPAVVTDNMLCSGWLDVGDRDACQGDFGGPLYHNGVVVGVTSWGASCAHPRYPVVNTRLTKFVTWIAQNA